MNSDLVSVLSTVQDPRSDKNKRYLLEEILLLCVCAAISGADGWKSIAEFGRTKLNWLRKFLEFKNGTPSDDCIGWVMARLSPTALQECFITWTKSIADLTKGDVIAIDGKTLRGSHDRSNGRSAVHTIISQNPNEKK